MKRNKVGGRDIAAILVILALCGAAAHCTSVMDANYRAVQK